MSKVRAKMKVTSITNFGTGIGVKLTAVYSTDPKNENRAFSDATPSANIDIQIAAGKPAADAFVVGDEYYVDFTAVNAAG